MIKCRVFQEKYVWSEKLFFIPLNISFPELKNNTFTAFLSKDNYIGSFEFDEDFLFKLNIKKINGNLYYHN